MWDTRFLAELKPGRDPKKLLRVCMGWMRQLEWTVGLPSQGPRQGGPLFSYLAFGFGGTPAPISWS